MKVSVKNLRSIIKEELAAQAPPDAPLGQYAWPKERHLNVNEPDTEVEQKLLSDIVYAIEYTEHPIPKDSAELLHKLLNNGWYSKVIRSPSAIKIYRGMSISNTKLEEITGSSELTHYGSLDKDMKFKPRYSGSCWSKKSSVSSDFAFPSGSDQFAVILVADVAKNRGKLVDFGSLYDLSDRISDKQAEEEVFAIGDIAVSKIIWASKIAFDLLPNVMPMLLNGEEIKETKRFLLATQQEDPETELELISSLKQHEIAKEVTQDRLDHYSFKTTEASVQFLRLLDNFLVDEQIRGSLRKMYVASVMRFITRNDDLFSLVMNDEVQINSEALKQALHDNE